VAAAEADARLRSGGVAALQAPNVAVLGPNQVPLPAR
jgi:hypothetical protein